MKRIIALLLLTALVLCMPGTIVSNAGTAKADDAGETGQIMADGVNVRKSPDKESESLGELNCGEEVLVLAEDGNWYRIKHGETLGYVRKDYVFTNSAGSRGAYAVNDDVNLMGAPSNESYVVCSLSAGQGLKVKALIGEWYYAVVDSQAGYIHRTDITVSSSTLAGTGMLKQGMTGEEVTKLQQALYDRGFLTKENITGTFTSQTRKAVMEYQQAMGLSADGIAGNATLSTVYDSSNKLEKENADYYKLKGTVVLLDWFKGGNEWLNKGARFTVTDVRTGKSFRARRFGGWYHADSEPITKSDTAVMKSLEGFSWNRRPIWVTYNGKTVAASMHTMPHMANPTESNGFDGHFCIHLYHSKVHANSKECPRHQSCVMEAYNAGKKRD